MIIKSLLSESTVTGSFSIFCIDEDIIYRINF